MPENQTRILHVNSKYFPRSEVWTLLYNAPRELTLLLFCMVIVSYFQSGARQYVKRICKYINELSDISAAA